MASPPTNAAEGAGPASASRAWGATLRLGLPFTPRGLAALAQARPGRLLVVQCLMALALALVVLWFLASVYFPVVQQAINALPEVGFIRAQQLQLPAPFHEPLAMNHHLGIVVDPTQAAVATVASDLVLEFHRHDFVVCSLAGCAAWYYPAGSYIEFNKPALVPRWEAWKPHLLWMSAAAVFAAALTVWTLLAVLYMPGVKLLVFFRDRRADWSTCGRLAGAALMPGALVLMMALVFYGLEWIDLLKLGVFFALHFLVGWVYCVIAVGRLPGASSAGAGANPFTSQTSTPAVVESPIAPPSERSGKFANPFAASRTEEPGKLQG